MLNIDRYSYLSRLRDKAPLGKLFFSCLTLAVCLFAGSLAVSILVLIVMGWCTVYLGGTPLRVFLGLMAVPAAFLTIGTFSVAIDFSAVRNGLMLSVPFAGAYAGVTQHSLWTAFLLFWKSIGAASCMYYLSLTTPAAALLTALYGLGIPSIAVELMGLIYRFIFILLETAGKMLTAQSSRLGYSGIAASYRSLAMLASSLFINSFRRSDELYTALEARGYEGKLNVLEDEYETSWKDFVPAVLVNLILIAMNTFLKKYTGGLL